MCLYIPVPDLYRSHNVPLKIGKVNIWWAIQMYISIRYRLLYPVSGGTMDTSELATKHIIIKSRAVSSETVSINRCFTELGKDDNR